MKLYLYLDPKLVRQKFFDHFQYPTSFLRLQVWENRIEASGWELGQYQSEIRILWKRQIEQRFVRRCEDIQDL